MIKTSSSKILGNIILDELKEFLYFPFWWYGKGLVRVINGSWEFVKGFEESLGLMIWVKNLFVPMFGQRDIAGRLISFFLRLFQIAWKVLVLLILIVVAFAFIISWLILPVFVIYQVIIHI